MHDSIQVVKYIIKRDALYLADGLGSWHWKLSEAWQFSTMQEALPWMQDGDELFGLQVTTSYHEIGAIG